MIRNAGTFPDDFRDCNELTIGLGGAGFQAYRLTVRRRLTSSGDVSHPVPPAGAPAKVPPAASATDRRLLARQPLFWVRPIAPLDHHNVVGQSCTRRSVRGPPAVG
jgi:hypothetical protein